MQILRLPLYISTLTARGVLAPRSTVWEKARKIINLRQSTFIAIGLYVQFLLLLLLLSHQVMSDSLRSHGQQHTKLLCPSSSPGVCWSSCPLSWWCHWNHLILCLSLLLLPSIFPKIKVFSNESALPIMWPKYWSFSFSISPSNEYSGLISLQIDWLDLLAVQGILKSLLQSHSSKAPILWHPAVLTSFGVGQKFVWIFP